MTLAEKKLCKKYDTNRMSPFDAVALRSILDTFGRKNLRCLEIGSWFGTGSNSGGSAFIRGASATGTVSASFGGALDLADLTVGVVYEIQPSAVSASGGTVYVLYGASR